MLVLDGGLDWKPLGGSAVDAQMLETRTFTRDEVCAVYDIPPPMVGILDRATFSNIDEQHRMLYQDTLGPWLVNLESTLQTQLIDPELRWKDMFIEFDLDEVLRGDVEKRSQAYQRFLMAGAYTPNEIRRMENNPMIDNPLADAIYVPLNMQAVGDGLAENLVSQDVQQAAAIIEALRDR
jgi:HK97 family phage portal protein